MYKYDKTKDAKHRVNWYFKCNKFDIKFKSLTYKLLYYFCVQ